MNDVGDMLVRGLVSAAVFLVVVVPVLILLMPIGAAVGLVGTLLGIGVGLARRDDPLVLPPADAVPDDPVDGVAGAEPAWRAYPGPQALRDAGSALGRVSGAIDATWQQVDEIDLGRPAGPPDLGHAARRPFRTIPLAVATSINLGCVAGGATGAAALAAGTGVVWTVEHAAAGVARSLDRARVRRTGATATCVDPDCTAHGTHPVVRCSCGRLHRDLRPGAYGTRRRRCRCGVVLPATVTRAAAAGFALVCPWCAAELPAGSMTDRGVLVVATGAAAAGTSTVVDAGLAGIGAAVRAAGGASDGPQVMGVDAVARTVAMRLREGGRSTLLTVVDLPASTVESGLSLAAVHAVRDAHAYALVIDAVTLPRIAEVLDAGPGVDPEIAYRTVVARLRDTRVDLRGRALAVVLHKIDALEAARPWRGPKSGPEGVADWLVEQGHASLVRAARRDFGTVGWFATGVPHGSADAIGDGGAIAGPAPVLAWLARRAGARLPGGDAR